MDTPEATGPRQDLVRHTTPVELASWVPAGRGCYIWTEPVTAELPLSPIC